MSKVEAVSVAVRLFAITIIVYFVLESPGLFYALGKLNENTNGSLYLLFFIYFLLIISAFLLWKYPMGIAELILPKTSLKSEEFSWKQEDVLVCGSILLGLYFLFNVISDAAYWFFFWQSSLELDVEKKIQLSVVQKAGIYATIIEFMFAVVLMFGAKGITNLLLKIRYAGMSFGNKPNE